jgi:hypothetical protein
MITIKVKGQPRQGAYGSYYKISPRRGVKVLDGGEGGEEDEDSSIEADKEWEHLCLAWKKRKKLHKELGIKIPRPSKRVKVQYGRGEDATVYHAVMMEHIQGRTLNGNNDHEDEVMRKTSRYFTDSHDGNFIKKKGNIYRIDFGFPPTKSLKKLK